MKKANKEEFYQYLSAVYNLETDMLSQPVRDKILETAQSLDKDVSLYWLADRLAMIVNTELTGLTWRAPKELVDLARYLQELQTTYRRFAIGLDDLEEE